MSPPSALRAVLALFALVVACTLPVPARAQVDPAGPKYVANWQLPEGEGLYERWDPNRSWAASHVISTIQLVAERLALELPLADPLMIGDISRRGGGHMPGHSTHHMGIDVDVGVFMDNGRQPLGGFVNVSPDRMDVASTWILVRSFLDTGQVQHVLLDQSLINVLKDHVLHEVGLDRRTVDGLFPPPSRRLTWSLRNVIRHAPRHADHLHFRLVPPLDPADLAPPPGPTTLGAVSGWSTPACY